MEQFQFNMYNYIAFLSRSYTLTGEPHVLFIKVPRKEEMQNEQMMFLDNIPKGLKVFIETPGNVESAFLVSANVLRGTDSEAIQDDVDLMYSQFGNEKLKLNNNTEDICHKYISSIWTEQFYGLEVHMSFVPDEYDYIIHTVGNMPFPALAYVSKDNFNLIDCDKLKDLKSNGVSLKVGQTDKDGNVKYLKVFFINAKTVAGIYLTELRYICHHIQQFNAGNLPATHNVELLNNFIGEL